jgi:hypothetical protein
MHRFYVGASFERIAIDITGPSSKRKSKSKSKSENIHLLIAMDCFTKWLEAFAIPSREASTVVDVQVTNFFCCFGVLRELHNDHSQILSLDSCKKCCSPWG